MAVCLQTLALSIGGAEMEMESLTLISSHRLIMQNVVARKAHAARVKSTLTHHSVGTCMGPVVVRVSAAGRECSFWLDAMRLEGSRWTQSIASCCP